MGVAVLSIGTELTRGELVNTNAAWLSEALTALGFEVTEACVVDDDRTRIEATLRRLGAEQVAILVTGGLGPTTDDITTLSVAGLLGVSLVRDGASLEAIRQRLERAGRVMAVSNEKQADFPEGARVLPNALGTAPGFAVGIGRASAFFMPGVPREMKHMFTQQVAPALSSLPKEPRHQIRIRCFGLPESTINDRLAGIEAEHQVTLGYRAHFPEIEVKVLAGAATLAEAEQRALRAASEVKRRLGADVAYGEGEATLPAVVGELCSARGLTLGLAESCTGGLVAELLTEQAGSSKYFAGGVVSYSNQLKRALLGVPERLLATHGAVSAQVASAMAENARQRLAVDVALSITGIAGPSGGTPEKPVGLVHFAVSTADGLSAKERVFSGSRWQVRRASAFFGLALVRHVLLHGHAGN